MVLSGQDISPYQAKDQQVYPAESRRSELSKKSNTSWGCAFLKLVKLACLVASLLVINLNLTKLQSCILRHFALPDEGQSKIDFALRANECRSQIIDPALPAELTICPPNNALGTVPFVNIELKNATLLALSGADAISFARWGSRCYQPFPRKSYCLLYSASNSASARPIIRFPLGYSCDRFAKFDKDIILCNPLHKPLRILSINAYPFSVNETAKIFKAVRTSIILQKSTTFSKFVP